MMKNVNKYLLFILLLTILSLKTTSTANENNVNNRLIQKRQSGQGREDITEKFEDALPEDFSYLTDINLVKNSIGMDTLLAECVSAIKGEGASVLKFLLLSLSLFAITATCGAVCNGAYPIATRSVSLIALSLLVARLMPIVDEVTGVCVDLGDFLLSLIPILSGISASLGHLSVATSQATAMSLTLSFFGGEGAHALGVIVKCLFVLALLSVFTKESGKLMGTLKSIFMWGLGIITTLLGGVTSIQTLISRGADNATMMATKYAIGNMLPLAGGAVSAALSTLVGGMSYYVTLVGGGAIAVVALTAISPLITLLMYKLALSVSSFFVSFTGNEIIEIGVKAVSGALDALIALYSVTTVIYTLEIMLFLRQGLG